MPSVTVQITPAGPVVMAHVTTSRYRAEALVKAGLTPPPWRLCRLLVDTGASGTCIDEGILLSAGSAPIDMTSIHTPSTDGVPETRNVYDAQIFIAPQAIISQTNNNQQFSSQPFLQSLRIVGISMKDQPIDGLLGRDVLSCCNLIYHGNINLFVLSW